MVVHVSLPGVLPLEISVRVVTVAKGGVIVLVRVLGAQVLEPAARIVVVVGDMKVPVVMSESLVIMLFPLLVVFSFCHVSSRDL